MIAPQILPFPVVNNIFDKRIKIYRNDLNIGVLQTFERAINLATGELIFLSDQDDIWHLEKVATFMELFKQSPEITLVLSDARIVDEKGDVVCSSYFQRRGRFKQGIIANLIKNKYLGCVIAFRSSLLNKLLPFPPDTPQHDMWIGLVCATYGKAAFVSVPLVDYRRHQNNSSSASTGQRGTIAEMVLWRWRLMKNLLVRILSVSRKST